MFLQEIVGNTDLGLDLHTGAIHRSNLPQIRTDLGNLRARELALAFGAPVILDSEPPPGGRCATPPPSYTLASRCCCTNAAKRCVSTSWRSAPGCAGCWRYCAPPGMLPARPRKGSADPVIARRSGWMRAPHSGIMRAPKPLGARVAKGDILAVVGDPFGGREEPITARFSGVVIGASNLPLVSEGDALFHVASVPRPGEVEEQVEAYHEQLADMDELAGPGAVSNGESL